MTHRTSNRKIFHDLHPLLLAALCSCAGTQDPYPDKLPPEDAARMRLAMAEALVKQNDLDKALPYLTGLKRSYPRSGRVHLLLGVVLRDKGQPEAAEKELDLALKLSPSDPEVHSARGILLDLQKEHTAAEKLHRKALDMSGDNPRYHNNLGWCLFLQKRFEDAEEEVKEAIRLSPDMRRAFNNLGFIYGLQGNTDRALSAFNQGGSPAMALNNLGLVEEMRGRPVSARRYYERALKMDGSLDSARKNLRAIQPQLNLTAATEDGGDGAEAGPASDQGDGEAPTSTTHEEPKGESP